MDGLVEKGRRQEGIFTFHLDSLYILFSYELEHLTAITIERTPLGETEALSLVRLTDSLNFLRPIVMGDEA
jgi:hypothetical protein